MLVKKQKISYGDPVDYCVPTGNFGNILAGYYAKSMGLPIRKLICASNKNNILTDFFDTGTYDRNRAFYKTVSPSMDILISSNLERFLFEITGHDTSLINEWYKNLGTHGKFSVGSQVKKSIDSLISAGWVDEDVVLSTISDVYHTTSNVIDTHTAVAVAVLDKSGTPDVPTVITSTASPYKFSCDVLKGIKNTSGTDEFSAIKEVASLSGKPIHRAVDGLENRAVQHDQVINIGDMKDTVRKIIKSIQGKL